MNVITTLYIKELKELRLVAAFALVSTVALGMYAVVGTHSGPGKWAMFGVLLLPYLSALVLPFLLIHAFSAEWNDGTHYRLLSLPVSRVGPVLAKVAASWSLGATLFVANTAALHATYVQLRPSLESAFVPHIEVVDGWLLIGAMYFGTLLLLSGIACVAAVVKLLVPRFKGLAAAAVFLLGFYLHGQVRGLVSPGLHAAFGPMTLKPVVGMSQIAMTDVHTSLIYTCGVGLVFVLLGAVLFDRFAEA